MAKQYGLTYPSKEGPKKAAPVFTANKNVFGDDSDSDDNVKVSKISTTGGEKLKRQAKAIQEKVIEEDPTVYQYDELYDDISAEKNKKRLPDFGGGTAKQEEKKPKYIEKLLETAERRKKENERRIERQVQKEREEEGDKFADKEAYVTSAYKKKLEEMRAEEERERREKYLEDIGDVTKQSDLGGFYRHLYEQQLRPEKQRPDILKIDKTKKESPNKDQIVKTSKDNDSSNDSDKEEVKQTSKQKNKNTTAKDKRSYRKRKTSIEEEKQDVQNDSDEEVNRKAVRDKKSGKKPKLADINQDADSDFSIDESSSESDGETIKEKTNVKVKQTKDKVKSNKVDENVKISEDKETKIKKEVEDNVDVSNNKANEHEFKKPGDVGDKVKCEDKDSSKPVEVVEEVKPKIDIWKKRTVGEVFDQAVERYYKRKAARAC